jgi:fatty acid desaturase
MGLVFNLFHDASHFSLFNETKQNFRLASFLGGFLFWMSWKWEVHHTLRHHSFTGDPILDPDEAIFGPGNNESSPRWWLLSAFSFLVPGQAMFYATNDHLVECTRTHSVREDLSTLNRGGPVASLLFACGAGLHLIALLYLGFCHGVVFLLALSFFYTVNLLGDHHQDGMVEDLNARCWFRRQVTASKNFVNRGWMGLLWARWFVSINMQVTHHLLPKIPSWCYPRLAGPVAAFCAAQSIPIHETQSILEIVCGYEQRLARNSAKNA